LYERVCRLIKVEYAKKGEKKKKKSKIEGEGSQTFVYGNSVVIDESDPLKRKGEQQHFFIKF